MSCKYNPRDITSKKGAKLEHNCAWSWPHDSVEHNKLGLYHWDQETLDSMLSTCRFVQQLHEMRPDHEKQNVHIWQKRTTLTN